jgi:predicted amidohydrolase
MKSSANKRENLQTSVDYMKEAAKKKAQLICFPEFQMAYSPVQQSAQNLAALAENATSGNFISTLRREAKRDKLNVVATIYENLPKNQKDRKSLVSDTAVVISERGEVRSIYRKLHLYDALGFKESDKLAKGSEIEKPVSTAAAKIGLMICYDVRFPEMSRILALAGADVLVVPSAWVQGVMKEEHWQIMLKARAIENGCYVVAPDQVGNVYSGRSMVVDPFGITLLDMGGREGVEVIEIDPDRLKFIRRSLPLLNNRRSDVYQKYLKLGSSS